MDNSAHHKIASCLRPVVASCLREIFGVGKFSSVIFPISNWGGATLDISDLRLQSGDLLFVRMNGVKGNAGRCCMFERDIEDGFFASHPIRVRLDPRTLNPSLLNEYSRTETGTLCLSGKAIRTADGKFNINSGTLKAVLVPVPPIDEQEEIARALALSDTKSSCAWANQDLFRTLLHQLITTQTCVDAMSVNQKQLS